MFLKSAVLALSLVAATAGGASAAQYAWADQDAKVRAYHQNGSDTVNWISEGQKVKIIDAWGNWYKIQIPGYDGWVKANALDFTPYYGGGYPSGGYPYGGSVCVGGYSGSFCLSASY